VGQQIDKAVRSGSDNQDCDSAASQVLLVLEAFVHGQKQINPGSFGERQQEAILAAGESCFRHGLALMAVKGALEFARDTFVK